jgi:hypothetical protein
VDYQIFVPRVDMSLSKMLFISYLLLTFVLPMENYLYFRPVLQKRKEKSAAGVAVIAVIGLLIVITLFVVGIYGLNGAADEPMTTIAIMRYIRLPFGVLERFDVLMIWFLMIGCFVLVCQTLYCAGYLFCRVCKRGRLVWVLLFALLLSLCIVLFLRSYENGLLSFVCYGIMMDVPLSIILPLLGVFVNYCYGKLEMSETESEAVEE